MKVLHVANFPVTRGGAVFYNMDRKFSTGLTRNQCSVRDFSYREVARAASPFGRKFGGVGAMNRQLRQQALQLKPDLLLLGHAELVQPQTLADLRQSLPQMRVAQWWVDSLEQRKLPVIGRLLSHLDVLFTTHGARYAAKVLREAGFQPPAVAFVPNCCDAAIENGQAFAASKPRYDLFFAGRVKSDRPNLHQRLRQLLPQHTLGLFGEKGNELFGSDLVEAIAQSRCGLNLSVYRHADFYSSDRLIQLTASGTLVFSNRFARLEELFADDEVIAFDELEELPSLMRHWLAKNRWRKPAEASWKRAHGSYSTERVMRWLLDVAMREKAPSDCEWSGEYLPPQS